MGETLEKIAFLYQLEEEELKKENKHIRIWEHLVPGIKLKIPTISESVEQDISTMEPFIEDYYPKLKLDISDYQESQQVKKEYPTEVVVQANEPEKKIPEIEMIKSTSSQEIKTFETEKPASEEKKQVTEYIPPQYYYPQYVYYQYPRVVYPSIYYPIYYYPKQK